MWDAVTSCMASACESNCSKVFCKKKKKIFRSSSNLRHWVVKKILMQCYKLTYIVFWLFLGCCSVSRNLKSPYFCSVFSFGFPTLHHSLHIHCITQYYAKQGIFWKPGKTSKFRPIQFTIWIWTNFNENEAKKKKKKKWRKKIQDGRFFKMAVF